MDNSFPHFTKRQFGLYDVSFSYSSYFLKRRHFFKLRVSTERPNEFLLFFPYCSLVHKEEVGLCVSYLRIDCEFVPVINKVSIWLHVLIFGFLWREKVVLSGRKFWVSELNIESLLIRDN
jgi:hypothetical protein